MDKHISRGPIDEQIKRFRQNLAAQIQALLDDGVIAAEATVAELIAELNR